MGIWRWERFVEWVETAVEWRKAGVEGRKAGVEWRKAGVEWVAGVAGCGAGWVESAWNGGEDQENNIE